jgi:dienelactone hydrolase
MFPRFFQIASICIIGGAALADSRNTGIVNTNTHFAAPRHADLAAWQARRLALQRQILVSAGLDPLPERTPLTPQIFGRLERNGYSIEKVLLQTLPGYWLGGNLYRPLGKSGKFPAVAAPHGHWTYGRLEHQPLGSTPTRCINMAKQGYVVFAYDMVGYNDTVQTPHAFGGKREQLWSFGPLGLQLWNSIRVVDFLEALPEVDRARIGATGASGGGTQTFLLSAVDDRVAYSSPVNMVSFIMQGGSPCENAPGLRIGTNNVEIAAMAAPRPMLLVAATGDWTKNVPREEFPAIREIYRLYGKAENVEAVQFDSPHNYHKDSREAVYRFFAKHALGLADPTSIREQESRMERLQDMLALHGRALPPGALSYDEIFTGWRAMSEVQAMAASVEQKRARLAAAIGASWPDDVAEETAGVRVYLNRAGTGERVPAVWHPGRGRPVLFVHPQGAEAARGRPDAARLLADGRPVLMIDAFQTGVAAEPRKTDVPHYLAFNRTDDAYRVQDILTAWYWLEKKTGGPVGIVAEGAAAVWATFAASVANRPVRLNAPLGEFRGTDQDFERAFFVPGIQRAGGLAAAQSVLAVSPR